MFPPKPMRAWSGSDLHAKLIADDRWICEPKVNGDRCLVIVENTVELWSRHGRRVTYSWLAPLYEALKRLNLSQGTMLDAELVAKPKPSCELIVFDVPSLGGLSQGDKPLSERRELLMKLLRKCREPISICPWLDKADAYERALAEGREGIVFKKLDSKYRWQRGPTGCEVSDWIKMKPAKKPDLKLRPAVASAKSE